MLGRETIQEVELIEGREHYGQKTWILSFEGIDTVEAVSIIVQNWNMGFPHLLRVFHSLIAIH